MIRLLRPYRTMVICSAIVSHFVLCQFLNAQETLFVDEQLFIAKGGLLTVYGGVELEDKASVVNDGKILVKGHDQAWQNNGGVDVLEGLGFVHFKAGAKQRLGGEFSTTFHHLILENRYDIVLNQSIMVSKSLELIHTRTKIPNHKLTLLNPDPRSLKGVRFNERTRSVIDGVFERAIGRAGKYYFPVGRAYLRHGLMLDFKEDPSVDQLAVFFDKRENNNYTLNLTESGEEYKDVVSEGFWNLQMPNPTTVKRYDLLLETGNLNDSGLEDNNHAPLLAKNNAWDCMNCGVDRSLGANGGDGRTRASGFTKRKGLDQLSDITIGKVGIRAVEIFGDEFYCPDPSGTASAPLSATEGFTRYIWSNGATNANADVPLGDGSASVQVFNAWGQSRSATLSFNFYESPDTEDDQFEMAGNTPVLLDPLANDSYESDSEISIARDPFHGSVEIIRSSNLVRFKYTPRSRVSTSDDFVYEICNPNCTTGCSTSAVFIDIERDVQLIIPNGISPNNDGFNDVFVVQGLASFGQNTLEIFDRSGNIVYKTADYQNDWDGTANQQVIGGAQLPEGTYFYVLNVAELTTGKVKKHSGFIHLER